MLKFRSFSDGVWLRASGKKEGKMLELEKVLNKKQYEAVMQTEGPVVILSAAGSGKTRVVIYRIAHLISQGISPYNILAVDFYE